jgi:hypothetical protein
MQESESKNNSSQGKERREKAGDENKKAVRIRGENKRSKKERRRQEKRTC